MARVERRAGACPEAWIHLSPVADAPLICDRCGGAAREVHEIQVREVRDLPGTIAHAKWPLHTSLAKFTNEVQHLR